jgi:glutathione S-transferase
MTLRIWGRISSVNVQKVVWCAEELGIPYERLDVGGTFGGTKTPDYLAKNPNSLVPVLEEEDGWTMHESNAIVRYLAAKDASGALWPGQPRARAEADQWMEWQSNEFTPSMRDAFWQLIRVAAAERDLKAVEASVASSGRFATILDDHLARRRYIGGEAFSVADIVNGCAAHRWLNLPIERPALPNLQRWYAELKSRPASRPVTSLALS